MDKETEQLDKPRPNRWRRREVVYAVTLFAIAAGTLGWATLMDPTSVLDADIDAILFFFLYGLFTISIGYHHPNVGYYSFDRVSQVASILVLGPLPAAWVNGVASLLYPWHRLRLGIQFRDVLFASLHNAGLMALIVLVCGSLYTALGGAVPLLLLDGRSVMLLILLVLSMQITNDLGMLVMLKAGHRDTSGFFHGFAVALELGSGAAAVLVGVVYNTMDLQLLILLLAVLTLGMAALRQFANMRLSLERIVEERTDTLRQKTRELEQLATQDNLTGLFNRRHADSVLEQQALQSDRSGTVFSIALGDIDRFKQINDRHSHGIGDEVLRVVADTLRARCRKSDMIARYGGEEFLICFPDTTLAQAQKLCEELRAAVEQRAWSELGLDNEITMSFGVAESRPGVAAETVVGSADRRLYAAKNAGRNRVVA